MLRSIAINLARLLPDTIKRRIHRHPRLSRLASKSFAQVARMDGQVASIESGPLKGIKLKVSEHTSHAHLSGRYEAHVLDAIDRHVKAGFVCYDLGASIGYLSLLMARRAAQVYAFEPAPHAVREIRNHLSVNDFSNITIIEKPVSNGEFEVEFALNENAYGNEIVRGSSRWPTMKFTTTTVDNFAENHPLPDFIKIDVEGEEGRVLEGATKILSEKRPVFCIELHGNEVAEHCQKTLTAYGYKLFNLDDSPFELQGHVVPGEVQIIAKPA